MSGIYTPQDEDQGIFDPGEANSIDWSLIAVKDGKVDARGLHRFLGVQTKFADWITRQLADFGFQEGLDFLKNEKPIGIKQIGQTNQLAL